MSSTTTGNTTTGHWPKGGALIVRPAAAITKATAQPPERRSIHTISGRNVSVEYIHATGKLATISQTRDQNTSRDIQARNTVAKTNANSTPTVGIRNSCARLIKDALSDRSALILAAVIPAPRYRLQTARSNSQGTPPSTVSAAPPYTAARTRRVVKNAANRRSPEIFGAAARARPRPASVGVFLQR